MKCPVGRCYGGSESREGFMEEVMPKFASSRTCGSQIGRNGGKWRVGGHGHQVAEEGE